jgi:hypothetical protein
MTDRHLLAALDQSIPELNGPAGARKFELAGLRLAES